MPIDFAAIADEFRGPLHEQIHLTTPIFLRLHRQLERMVTEAERRVRPLRAFPLTQWVGDALAVTLTPTQAGALAEPARSLGVGEHVREGGRRFAEGMGWIGTAITQELVIPRTLEVPAEALEAVVASLERFAVPRPELFEPDRARFVDVFGALDMGVRGLLESEQDIRRSIAGGQHLGAVLAEISRNFGSAFGAGGAEPGPAGGAVPGPPPVALPARLRAIGESILAAVLLVPIASQTLLIGLRRVAPMLEEAMLIQLVALEASIGTLRSHLYPVLISLLHHERGALAWLHAVSAIVMLDVSVLGFFAGLWLASAIDDVRTYLNALATFANEWIAFVTFIRDALDALMSYDLMWPYSKLPGVPSVTLGDVADAASSDPARRAYQGFIWTALTGATLVAPLSAVDRIRALRDVLVIALEPRPMIDETGLFAVPAGGFPNIATTMLPAARLADLRSALHNLGDGARGAVGGIFSAGIDALGETSQRFAAAAQDATTFSRERFAAIARDAHRDAVESFAGPTARLEEEVRARRRDPLAEAFEQSVARGGLEIVFGAVPAYLGEVRRYWDDRAPTATSPHILARHGHVERVRVPRLTIRAPGRRADADSAAAIAARWRTAVGQAYLTGLAAGATP